MDPMPGEKLNYEEKPQKMQHYEGGTISALAEDELMDNDDEYDELYGDINVGEGFLQLQQSEAPGPYTDGAMTRGFQTPKAVAPEPRPVNLVTEDFNIHGVSTELIGDDDEYDDLYGDVNVGKGYLQLQPSEASDPYADGAMNEGLQTPKTVVPESTPVNLVPKELNIPGVPTDDKYTNSGVPLPDPEDQIAAEMVSNFEAINTSQKAIAPDVSHDSQASKLGFHGSTPVAQNNGIDPVDMLGKVVNESVSLLNPKTSVQQAVSHTPPNQSNDNVNMNRQFADANPIRPTGDDGATMLIVGELHWWTTDAEIESVSSKYGKVKEVIFFDEKASGKSKGYCLVKFYDSASAAACKEGMNGYNFNGRACTVAFASPLAIRQMGDSYMNNSQVQPQPQSQAQGRRPLNDNNAGRSSGRQCYSTGDSSRGYGRGGWMRGQGVGIRRDWHMRGVVGASWGPNMPITPGVGAGANSGGYGEGMGGPAFGGPPGGFMHPHGMRGAGLYSNHMARGLPAPAFPWMRPPFPNAYAPQISGASTPVNLAFFGRGTAANGMGMMGNAGMGGPNSGMRIDTNTGGWRPDESSQRTKESSLGSEDGASGYGYSSHDKDPKSNAISRGKERGSERDWSGESDKRPGDESDHDSEMYDSEHRYRDHRYREHRYRDHRYREHRPREHRYREERDDYRNYRQKDRYLAYKDVRDRGQTSARSRGRSRVMVEDRRSRSRDADYGKRRRSPSD